jgi:hypothetical protein
MACGLAADMGAEIGEWAKADCCKGHLLMMFKRQTACQMRFCDAHTSHKGMKFRLNRKNGTGGMAIFRLHG